MSVEYSDRFRCRDNIYRHAVSVFNHSEPKSYCYNIAGANMLTIEGLGQPGGLPSPWNDGIVQHLPLVVGS